MKLEEFIEQVQKRANLASKIDAQRATQGALETLAEAISRKERSGAAAQLPQGLAMYLKQPYLGPGKQPNPKKISSLDQFYQRMSLREDVPLETARGHALVVMSVLRDALSKGELEDIIAAPDRVLL